MIAASGGVKKLSYDSWEELSRERDCQVRSPG